MKYEEMRFIEVREFSAGYRTIFKDGMPANCGSEASNTATEMLIENAADEVHDRDTRLCLSKADGKLYRVVGNEYTAVKCWEEVELNPNRPERLKDFRDFAVGTLQNAQDKTGILMQNISKWETGARDIRKANGETLLKLAAAYGVTIEELIK